MSVIYTTSVRDNMTTKEEEDEKENTYPFLYDNVYLHSSYYYSSLWLRFF
jgi:hypothetical protein